jgi:hypothetical protein
MMRMLPILLATVCFAAISSSLPGRPATAYLVNNLTQDGSLLLEEARAEMERRSGEDFLSDDGSVMYIVIRYENVDDNILGRAQPSPFTCTIRMNPEMAPEYGVYAPDEMKLVLMHEIGHCFGLRHTPGKQDVMYYAHERLDDREKSMSEFIKSLKAARGAP